MSAAHTPSLGSILSSVRSLMTPLKFTPAEPSHCLRYEERTARGIPPLVDVYLPPGPGPHPSVVLFHGGGWVIGHRRMKPMRYLATKLLEAGYAVCVPEYRMVFRGGRLDEAVADGVSAVRWWLEQSPAWGVSSTSMLGLSAGGSLMLLTADALREQEFARLVPVFGVYDFSSMHGGIGRLIAPLFLRGHDPSASSPLRRPPPRCPVVLMHGDADTLVPISQAVQLQQRWQEEGADVKLLSYEGLPHAFFNEADSPGCVRATADLLSALAG